MCISFLETKYDPASGAKERGASAPLRHAQHTAIFGEVVQELHGGLVQCSEDALLKDCARVRCQGVPGALQGCIQAQQPGLYLVQLLHVDAHLVLCMWRKGSEPCHDYTFSTGPHGYEGNHVSTTHLICAFLGNITFSVTLPCASPVN